MNITAEQFRSYLEIQKSGQYNMLDPRAIMETRLDRKTYFYIIQKYNNLIDKYKDSEECKHLIKG